MAVGGPGVTLGGPRGCLSRLHHQQLPRMLHVFHGPRGYRFAVTFHEPRAIRDVFREVFR